MVFDELCLSLEESAANRSHISLQWQEIVKVAISKLSKVDSKIHYAFIKVSLMLPNTWRFSETNGSLLYRSMAD